MGFKGKLIFLHIHTFKLLVNTVSIRSKGALNKWPQQAGSFNCPQDQNSQPAHAGISKAVTVSFFRCPLCASSRFKLKECSCPLFIAKLLED